MSLTYLLILFAVVFGLYLGGRALGKAVGGKPTVWLAVTFIALAVNLITMVKPGMFGVVATVLGFVFPLALGGYRGAQMRAAQNQSGSGGA